MDWKYKDGAIYYTNDAGELMAKATSCQTKDDEIDINHVYVNPVLRGRRCRKSYGRSIGFLAKKAGRRQLLVLMQITG